MARTPADGSTPPQPRSLSFKLLVLLALAFAAELCSRLIAGFELGATRLAEGMSVAAILLAWYSIAALASHTRCGRIVRIIIMFSALTLSASIFLRICATIPALDHISLLGAEGAFHELLSSLTDLAGITAWVFGLFWMVFELQSTREALQAQHRQLMKEVDDHNRAEAVLRESEGRFRAVFNNVPVSMLVMSPQGRLVECNQALAAELGYSIRQLRDTAMESLVFEDDWQIFRQALETLQSASTGTPSFEVRLLSREARPVPYTIAATLVRPDTRRTGIVIAVLENIADRRLREQQIQRRQKMESLEVLAGGMAHDLNGLLAGIISNADRLAQLPSLPRTQTQACNDILLSARRASELCQQLLDYADKSPRQEQLLDLSHLVESSAQLLHLALSPQATIKFDSQPGLPPVSADPALLRQVLLNLVANASDALLGNAGAITISTGTEDLNDADFDRLLYEHSPEPGLHVYVDVTDQGIGMAEEELTFICDPFYTTKGRGSGLGLAAALGIVHAHRGLMSIKSSPNQGTSIRIYFPPATQRSESTPSQPDLVAASAPGGPIVLVVDDEAIVRNAAQRILEHSGYQVILAADGHEGVEVFEARHTELAAVLLDLSMPRMDGETACRKMRAINSEVPVILSSGNSESEHTSPGIFHEVAASIRKPYRLKQLLDILAEVT